MVFWTRFSHGRTRRACGVLLATLSLLCLPAAARAAYPSQPLDWRSVRMGGGGYVTGIIPSAAEADLVYARTDVGGAYRWEAATQSWIPLLDWVSAEQLGYLGVESLAIDPQQPNRLYLLVGTSYFNNGRTAILRSEDYGASFEIIDVTSEFRAHGNGMGRQNGERLAVDPHNSNILFCGTRGHGLFRSNDAGQNWTRLNGLNVTTTQNGNGICLVVPDPASVVDGVTQRWIVGVSRYGENLYLTEDAGASFTAVPGAPASFMPQRAALGSDGSLILTYANGAGPHGHWNAALNEPMDNGQVLQLDLATLGWTNVTPAGQARPWGGVSVDPTDPERLVLATINTWLNQNGAYGDRFFLSTDGGSSWTDVVDRGFTMDAQGHNWIVGQSIHWAGSIEFDPFDPSRVWVISGNGVYRTDDIDAAAGVWKFEVAGLEETVPLDLVSIPGGPLLSVIGDYDGFRHTDPALDAPPHRPGMGTTTGLAVGGSQDEVVLRVGSSMYYSLDQGLNWTRTSSLNGTQGSVAVSADGEIFLHSPRDSTTSFRSTNRGATWTAVSGLAVSNARPTADPVNSQRFYAYDPSGQMRVSSDGGASFSPAGTLPPNGYRRVTTVRGHEGHLWVPMAWNGLYRSTDGGQSFNRLVGVGYVEAVGVGRAAPEADYPTVYLWGEIEGTRGLWRSVDEGAQWVRVNDDAHAFGGPANGQFVVGDWNTFGRVYMSTAGRGIVYGEIPAGDAVPWNRWLEEHFSAPEQADDTLAGREADPDGDGLSNAWEHRLLSDPRVARDLASAVFRLDGTDGTPLRLALRQQARLADGTIVAEVSSDLATWAPLEQLFDETSLRVSPDRTLLERELVQPAGTPALPQLFLRFRFAP